MKELYSIDLSKNLSHHGIPGQKWGIQNGPPYPLKSEVNRQVRMSRYNREVTSAKSIKASREALGKAGAELSLKNLPRKNKATSPLEDAKVVNNSKEDNKARKFNCQNCSMAFELRRRGYDVMARAKLSGSNTGDLAKHFQGGKTQTIKASEEAVRYLKHSTPEKYDKATGEYKSFLKYEKGLSKDSHDRLISELKSQGSGARGIVTVGWIDGNKNWYKEGYKQSACFHAFNYIVKDGKVTFYDAQERNPKAYSKIDSYDGVDPREFSYLRTDNLSLNESASSCVQARKN